MHLILPNQLFPEPVHEEKTLLEHRAFFTRHNFHKQKLVLHRASMKKYQEQNDIENYITYDEDLEKPFRENNKITIYRPEDHKLRKWVQKTAQKHDCELEIKKSPMFLTEMSWNKEYFQENSYYQLSYYKEQRKRLDILLDDEDKPIGGKWSTILTMLS